LWNLNDIIEAAPSEGGDAKATQELLRKMHQTIKKVTEDVDGAFHFNTAISGVMELLNQVYAGISEKGAACYDKKCLSAVLKNLVQLVAPFVPHVAEEMWEMMGERESVFKSEWPAYRKDMLLADTVEVPVQINGKLRSTVELARGLNEEEVKSIVLSDAKLKDHIAGKSIRKWIILKDKLVNIVVQ
jgi:leucyl-tRNA synthetase